jgi:hypothetical protein
MPDTPFIENTQGSVRSLNETGGTQFVSQTAARSLINFPSPFIETSQVISRVLPDRAIDIELSQGLVRAIVRGLVSDPRVRAWTFTLDGHDFYVIKAGQKETLVYDLSTGQWFVWGSGRSLNWDVVTGINWVGGNKFARNFGSNIVVGSAINGSVFFLDPVQVSDEASIEGRESQPFHRLVTTQVPLRGYNRVAVYEMQLLGSQGDLISPDLNGITLLYSDDRGQSYVSAGVVTIDDDDFDARATWRSLGSFQSPGRLIRIEDNGALQRIDSLTMNSDLSE